jgi:phosphoribosyl 1,2-cyclic phosphodiesterase
MRIHVLASGSTGNAALIELGGHRFLIDAGLSCKEIELALQPLGYRGWDISAVLITHEHSDHIKGLDVLARRYHLPVFTREKTWRHLACAARLPGGCLRILEAELTVGEVKVESFSVSHDAADPVGFAFYAEGKKFAYMTDTGMVNSAMEEALSGADAAVLESNHDLKMLAEGSYPHYLKQRIRSQQGHLSNGEAGQLLSRLGERVPRHVFLAHLSQENNRPELALSSVAQTLQAAGAVVGRDVILHGTHPARCSSLVLP